MPLGPEKCRLSQTEDVIEVVCRYSPGHQDSLSNNGQFDWSTVNEQPSISVAEEGVLVDDFGDITLHTDGNTAAVSDSASNNDGGFETPSPALASSASSISVQESPR
ncbi:hypothetical protein E2C01_055352 [Portunus trituberculatus]|uniref:Uncharacterized protein n=1 Tax=Portunus trituberculatus TaxID=210409 RepID=A0A5B7GUH3_PORTR|nr:hypothetical protein [Portunus trituberculatus]